jgi:tetratricopeptide (TPR) repeat protein
MPEAEDPNVKHEREQKQLLLRVEVAKRVSESEFAEMVTGERWFEDKVTLLKARAAELFKQGFLEMAAAAYTRAIGLHAIKGEAASHALYGNRSACRCGFGDYEGALADAEECIRLSPSWYPRSGSNSGCARRC